MNLRNFINSRIAEGVQCTLRALVEPAQQ
jgi:hypothetical protein